MLDQVADYVVNTLPFASAHCHRCKKLSQGLIGIGDGDRTCFSMGCIITPVRAQSQKIVDPEEPPWVQPLESKDGGSLGVVSCYGCGANKSWDQTLTIVYRRGEFLVAGYARDWDWNSHLVDGSVETIMGSCDIDFLAGKGVVSDGPDEGKPIGGKFTP